MKVSLKRSELPAMHRNIAENLSQFKGARLTYAVVKNLKLLEAEVEAIQKASAPDEMFQEFESKRMGLIEEFSKKDENGQAITSPLPGNSTLQRFELADKEGFDAKFEELCEEYKESMEAREKQVEDVNSFLDEVVELDFHMIREESLNDELTGDLVALILPFIE